MSNELPNQTTPPSPLSESHDHYVQLFMTELWNLIGKHSRNLISYEMVGIIEGVKSKIEFDINIHAANEEIRKRKPVVPTRDEGPSPIIDKHGFPVE